MRAEMYGDGAWGAGSRAVKGGLPLLGTQGDLPRPLLCGNLPGPLGPFGKAVHRPAKALVAAADREQRVQGSVPPLALDLRAARLLLPGVRVVARVLCVGGDVVGGEEGVSAVDKPGVGWCVVVGGGEGVVPVVHEGHVRGGGWLLAAGDGDVAWDMVLEVAQEGWVVDPRRPFPRHGVGRGGAGWGVGDVGLVVAGVALSVHPPQLGVSIKVWPQVDGGHPDAAPFGGLALAVRDGERGALVSGDAEEGVEGEVSDALPQGGRLDEGGRPDVLAGARGLEAQHLLVSGTPEVLPYCCGVVEGVGLGRCGGWWCGVWQGGRCGRGGGGGAVIVVDCGVW